MRSSASSPVDSAAAPTEGAAGETSPAEQTAATGLRLRIPSIRLEQQVVARGLAADGTINPPPGTVMWFQGAERVRPGEVGTAVIAAHVETGDRRDVFADLADVEVSDRVEVVDPGGEVSTYRVTRAGAIDKQEVTTDQDVWGVNTTRSRLAIITCDDAFGFRGDGHRVANFVVIAERV